MSIEQKLRDNLEAAADALIVPEPRRSPAPTHALHWRNGLRFALAGAAAVLALAIPALILWSGGSPSSDVGAPTTDSPTVVGSTGQVTTLPEPSTTPSTDATTPAETQATLAEITVGDYELALTAERVDEEEDLPTATVTLRATPVGADRATDEIVVGTYAGFFWHPVTGSEAVCEFAAEPTADGADVEVQILLSASLGCSQPFGFVLTSGELSPGEQAPEDVALAFVSAWQAGDEELMSELADPDATGQTADLPRPSDPVYSYCEGAAGSTYCTFEDDGGELVVRVSNEPPARVIELIFVPDQ
jgi:hypothetical protein